MIGKTIAHYKILEKLGAGGMGVVYRAQDTKLKRNVAMKFLPMDLTRDEEVRERFIQEAQAASALEHNNICNIHEINETEDGQLYIIMAYYEGETLKQKIEHGPLDFDQALEIAMQIGQGLARAHEADITHRDIKPANVIITDRDEVKILDFGLAKLVGQTKLTKTGTTVGTVAYMSPQQASGLATDHKTDIWALGVVLYEILAGQLPFKGEYEMAVMYAIMNEDPEPLTEARPELPVELESFVNKALAKELEKRYQSVNDLLSDLKTLHEQPANDGSIATAFLKDLFQRRVPQILGLYFLLSFGLVQLLQWLVNLYPISPHLPEFGLSALASMIPAVLVLAYFHGKRGRDRWTKFEKIGIPINLLAAAALLFFLFQDKDLGASTTTVTLQDEEGNTIERVIPKSEFRKKVALFNFDNALGDSTLNWLQYGIALALEFDLEQDLFLDVQTNELVEKIQKAGFSGGVGLPFTLKRKIADDRHLDYFVSGSFAKDNQEFSAVMSLFETRRGKLLAERTFTGADIFQLIDEMSIQLKHDLGIPDYRIEEVKDLQLSEITTKSISAFRSFVSAYYTFEFKNDWEKYLKYLEQAVEEDPSFAFAQLYLAQFHFLANQSEKAETAMQATMRHIHKLPEKYQFGARYLYYLMLKQDREKAFRVLKMLVELYPEDTESRTWLAEEYLDRDQKDKALAEYQLILQHDPEQYDVFQKIGSIYEGKGEFAEALKYYKQYAEEFPDKSESFTALGGLYRTLGDHAQAKSYYEKALLIEPENITALQALGNIESNLGNLEQASEIYQDALKISKTPRDRREVYASLQSLYELRGQLVQAGDYMHLAWAEDEKFENLVTRLFNKLADLDTYVLAGNEDLAFRTIDSIETQLAPPWDKLISIGYLMVYVELEDADNAEKALENFEECIQAFGLQLWQHYVFFFKGRINEMRGEYEQAILDYQKGLQLAPTEADVNYDIGRCYRKLRELKKAEEYIQKNLKIEPFNPNAHYEISLVYWDMGKKEKALEHLQRALYVWKDADAEYKPAKKAREKLAKWKEND